MAAAFSVNDQSRVARFQKRRNAEIQYLTEPKDENERYLTATCVGTQGGHQPNSSDLEVFRQIEHFDAASRAAELPEPFAGILKAALAPRPAERTITMAQIAERLA
jgi:hypothetical protein